MLFLKICDLPPDSIPFQVIVIGYRQKLENIMDGYTLPNAYFKSCMEDTVETMMRCLKNPNLPLLEMQVRHPRIYEALNMATYSKIILTTCRLSKGCFGD